MKMFMYGCLIDCFLYGGAMDRVLVMCDKYAILSKGKEGRGGNVLGELKALTGIRPEAGFETSKERIKSYLECYGRRLLLDVGKTPLSLSERGLPDDVLERVGYYEFHDERSDTYHLNRLSKSEDNGTYVVAIKGATREDHTGADASGYSLFELLKSVSYVSRLALLSTGNASHGLSIDTEVRYAKRMVGTSIEVEPFEVEVTFHDFPLRLYYYLRDFNPLENVFTMDRERAIRFSYGRITLNGGKAAVTVRYFIYDNVSKSADYERTAASLLLVYMARENFHGSNKYVVDPQTGGIVSQTSSNLILAVLQHAASGNVHACAHCGRPVFGNSKFCRNAGCRTRYTEKAQSVVTLSDMSLEDALERFPAVKPITIEKWINEREGR